HRLGAAVHLRALGRSARVAHHAAQTAEPRCVCAGGASMEEPYDLIIVGAGPYGLSVAAHLNDIQPRPRLRVFGEPMSFWSGNMPLGMLLRSPWVASNLSDPKGALTLDAFRSEQGLQFEAPIPLDCFTSYGHWFQQRAVPEVDSRTVTNIESSSA